MNAKLLKVLMGTDMNDAAEERTCFHCPLRSNCSLWLWDAWNVNLPMCDCDDERLVNLKNSFEPDWALLERWSVRHPISFRKKSDERTFVKR